MLCTLCGIRPVHSEVGTLPDRWVYVSANLLVDGNLPPVLAVMKRAKAAGYNGIVLTDYKFSLLDQMPPGYFANAAKVRTTAAALGLDLYACVCPVGYSNGLLAHDPNLAEGLPAREAAFTVKGREIVPNGAGVNLLRNGDFEQAKGDQFLGWGFQDAIGAGTFADRTEHHGGGASLRVTDIGKADPQYGHGRIFQEVAVQPFHEYRLSVWVKTRDFETPAAIRALANAPDGHALSYTDWSIQKTQDWTRYTLVFNSLDHTKALIYFGVWGGKGGSLWWDDAVLEEAPLLNLLRRPGCPLAITDPSTGASYSEGRDFAPVADPKLGQLPWAGEYDTAHDPPRIALTPGSSLKDGQALNVSFSHAVVVGSDQVCACLSDPKADTLMADQIRRVNALLHPKGFFLSHDEIRVADWDLECRKRHQTPGQLLADNIRRCAAMVRQVSPSARLLIWSDMVDPAHNAHGDYYLVNGSWAGSWNGLPKAITVVNWNSDKPTESLPFFAKRGNPQVLAGYYDGNPNSIRPWLETGKGLPGLTGVMYTTWANRYDDLEAFAKAAWGGSQK